MGQAEMKLSPQRIASGILNAAADEPQPGGDANQREIERILMRSLHESMRSGREGSIGYPSIHVPVTVFNDRIRTATHSGQRPVTTGDVAGAFGVSVEALTVAHELAAEARTLEDRIDRLPAVKLGQTGQAQKIRVETVSTLADALSAVEMAQSSFRTLLQHDAIDRRSAQQILWHAGERAAGAERGREDFPRAQALIGILAEHAIARHDSLQGEVGAQRRILASETLKEVEAPGLKAQRRNYVPRADEAVAEAARGRLFAIAAALRPFQIATPVMEDAARMIGTAARQLEDMSHPDAARPKVEATPKRVSATSHWAGNRPDGAALRAVL